MPTVVNTNNLIKMSCAKISNPVFFHRFNPPSLTLDNVTHNTWDNQGKLQANNGGAVNPLHGEWGLERVVDTNGDLWTWFNNTNQQGRDANLDNVTINIVDAKGQPVGTWVFNNTTPVSYSQAGQDANTNSVMTETIRFYSTEIQYNPGQ